MEYVKALLDKQMQISFEIGGTFVYLWKVTSFLSNKFYTRNPSLHLQLQLISQESGFHFSPQNCHKVRVRCCDTRCDKRLHESKYLMSACLHDNHGYSSRVQMEIDFSSSHGRGWETLCKVDLIFPPAYRNLVEKDGLLVAFELELKS